MKPQRLTLEGFRSFRASQTIDFTGLGLFAIVGDTGAGKSSILEAMVYALYNKSTWSERDIKGLIALDADTMRVCFRFAVGDRTYEVTRSASRVLGRQSLHALRMPNDPAFKVDAESAVSREIARITGLPYETFIKTVVMPQGQFAELLTATEGARNKTLTELLGLDEIDRVREAIEIPTARAQDDLLAVQAKVGMLGADPQAELQAVSTSHEAAERKISSLASVCEQLSGWASALAVASARSSRLSSVQHIVDHVVHAASNVSALAAADVSLSRACDDTRERLAASERRCDEVRATEAALRASGGDEATASAAVAKLQYLASSRGALLAKHNEFDDETVALRACEHRLTTLKSEEMSLVAAADAARQAHEEAERAAEAARERELAARDAWRALQNALQSERSCSNNVLVARRDLDATRTQATLASSQSADAAESFAIATHDFEQAQRTDAAAAAALGLTGHDACPICERALPADFVPPRGVDIASTRKQKADADRARLAASQHEAMCNERSNAANARLKAAFTEAALATKRTAAHARLATELGLDPAITSEQQALAAFVEATVAARAAVQDVTTRSSETASRLAAHRAREKGVAEQAAGDRRRLAALAIEIKALERNDTATLEALTESMRPESLTEPAIARALGRAQEAVVSAGVVRREREQAEAAVARHRAAAGEADRTREREVLAPKRAAIARADALLAQLGADDVRAPVPERGADENDDFTWATALEGWARNGTAALAREVEAAEEERAVQAERIRELLEEFAFDDAPAAVRAYDEAKIECARLTRDVELARERVETANTLRRRLEIVEPLANALGRLRFYLREDAFKKFLMRRRERTLLGCATRVLRNMTAGRYAFAEGFAIFDGFTGQTRDARTLSGGEKFLASLALALGLVEIASLAGGRLDALFLDEGFGSLDAAALDAALVELSTRATAGKMIGVITHVGTVADAVETVLRVRRLPSGSTVTRLTGIEREEFLGDAASGLLEAAG